MLKALKKLHHLFLETIITIKPNFIKAKFSRHKYPNLLQMKLNILIYFYQIFQLIHNSLNNKLFRIWITTKLRMMHLNLNLLILLTLFWMEKLWNCGNNLKIMFEIRNNLTNYFLAFFWKIFLKNLFFKIYLFYN